MGSCPERKRVHAVAPAAGTAIPFVVRQQARIELDRDGLAIHHIGADEYEFLAKITKRLFPIARDLAQRFTRGGQGASVTSEAAISTSDLSFTMRARRRPSRLLKR